MRNRNPRMNQLKHQLFKAMSSTPSAEEQEDIDKRQTEGDRREAIFVELVDSIEEFARLIRSGRIDGTETITYAASRPWVPKSLLPKLRFSTHKETAKVLYCEGRGKKGSSVIAITESGTLVSSFLIDGNNWVNGPVERPVNINRVRPNDIHPDTWWKVARAAQQAKSILVYAKSKKVRD